MVIECSSCHARFKLADDKIKESGTKVRCTKCREVFAVFPESSSPIAPPVVAALPVSPVAPVATPQNVLNEISFSSENDIPPLATEIPPPAANVPAREEAGEDQNTIPDPFLDGFVAQTAATDLDAISFDNMESPVFSVTKEKDNTFQFDDDAAFSFSDFSLERENVATDHSSTATNEHSLETQGHHDFATDYSAATLSAPEDLKFTTEEFALPETDKLADFPWNEPDTGSVAKTLSQQTKEVVAAPQETGFDFSSLSFDDAVSALGSSENNNDEPAAHNEATIELALEKEMDPLPLEIRSPAIEMPTSPATRERQENGPRTGKPLRPRVRPKKKGSSKPVKTIIFILLVLAMTYGVMNRDQVQTAYQNIVNRFIENQSKFDKTGRFNLTDLSGAYLLNSQEGELFVIRGKAINEFKELRSSVLVKGTIYGDNGAILQSQAAYCGNPLTDDSLKKLSFKEIRNIMSNELGENLVNLNIATGKDIPFTIVFNKVPKNIKEFTVEILESKPGSN